jgi:hypothetical protein
VQVVCTPFGEELAMPKTSGALRLRIVMILTIRVKIIIKRR